MPELNIEEALNSQKCNTNLPDIEKLEPFGDELEKVLNALGADTKCIQKSGSACASFSAGAFGVVGVGTQACAGYEESVGCTSLALNFQQTLNVKNSISCSIKQAISKQTTELEQSNTVNLTDISCTACACAQQESFTYDDGNGGTKIATAEDFCGKESCCVKSGDEGCGAAIGVDQKNSAKIVADITFDANTEENITEKITSAVKADLSAAVDINKEGVGITPDGDSINASQIQDFVNDNKSAVTQTVRDSLLKLSQSNDAPLENVNITSYSGTCLDISQSNVIDLVVTEMVTTVIKEMRDKAVSTDMEAVFKATTIVKSEGTDVGKGADAEFKYDTSIAMIIGAVIIVGIVAGGYFAYKRFAGGSGGGRGGGRGGGSSLNVSKRSKYTIWAMAGTLVLTMILMIGLSFLPGKKAPPQETAAEKKKREDANKKATASWITGVIGFVILMALSGFLFFTTRAPPPNPLLGKISIGAGGFSLVVTIIFIVLAAI